MTGENLLRLLELRLDNVVFRMGFATQPGGRPPARHPRPLRGERPADQHRRRTSSSRATGSRSASRIASREPFKIAKETLRSHQPPDWLSVDAAKLAGSVLDQPRRDQMPLDLNEQLVVEYYSR